MSRLQHGFALMLAVFLIVTLAAVGIYLVTMSTAQVQSASQDEQATRAYQAARAGLEWGVYRRLISGACAPTTTLTFTPAGLSGFRAVVTCVQDGLTETEGGANVSVYLITSTGCNANPCTPGTPTPGYVERQVHARVTP